MRPGRRLNITARRVHSSVVIEVDRGPGIEAQHLDSVFDRFWRAERSGHVTRGSGLGLSIARAICQAHGSTVPAIWSKAVR